MGAWETLTLILAPAAGGLVVSALRGTVGGFDSEPRKDGKQSPHSAGGIVPERLREPLRPVLKAISATVTLGTGASLGPEGPSVEIGKAIAKGVGKLDRAAALVEGRMTSILAAGAAAGVAAGFNAAISGVFFSFESVLATVSAGWPSAGRITRPTAVVADAEC